MGAVDERRIIAVEVCYATPDEQAIVALRLALGSTLADAIERSGLLARFTDIDLKNNKIGVYGKLAALNDQLRDKDRVEIYRALRADPKESRRRRARQS